MSAPLVHVELTQEAGHLFHQSAPAGRTFMLNLLRFRKVADSHPDLAPITTSSGSEAFDRCVPHTLPYLHESNDDHLPLSEMPLPLCADGATS